MYSGGGIEPDRRFDGPSDGFNPTRFGRTIAARNLFDNYAQQFTRQGRHPRRDAAAGRFASWRPTSR